MRRFAAAFVLLASLAACAPMEWSRADAGPEQASADMRACREQAWRESLFYDRLGRRYFGGPYFYSPLAEPFDDRFFEESRLASFCMRAKGYELAPVRQ